MSSLPCERSNVFTNVLWFLKGFLCPKVVMLERLAKEGQEFEVPTRLHMNEYADDGLRTMVLAYRELDEEEYDAFSEQFTQAKNSMSADHDEIVEAVAEKIEKDLILLGATAVEDKLQAGVPECIGKLGFDWRQDGDSNQHWICL